MSDVSKGGRKGWIKLEDGFDRMVLMGFSRKNGGKLGWQKEGRERYFLFPSLITLSDSLIFLPRSFFLLLG